MSNPKAQAAKDKGNLAFKAGDYPTAIGHYTSAILADRTDATFPLNRAAAYLKLGKNEDAERDCTTVLRLSPKNVKALFRRGQARLGMGKLFEAQRDFTDALLAEPSNSTAQEELKKVTALILKEKAKKSRAPISPVQASLEPAAAAKRRRVPIMIVEPSGSSSKPLEAGPSASATKPQDSLEPQIVHTPRSSTSVPDTLEAVSSRSLKASTTPAAGPYIEATSPRPPSSTSSSLPSTATNGPSDVKPGSFREAKQARESAKPSRAGGGIFRASGQNTIFPTRGDSPSTPSEESSTRPSAPAQSTPTAQTSSKPAKLNGSVYKTPSSLFDFTKAWGSLTSSEEKWQYINTIPPAALPALCKTSLEPSLLVAILETFLAVLTAASSDPAGIKHRVMEYMDHFAKVPRFGTLVLFLSKAEKAVAKQIWSLLGVEKPAGVWAAVA